MKQETIQDLANYLEEAGYYDAIVLIEERLIPKARKDGSSLRTAMINYSHEKGLTSEQLRLALLGASISGISHLEIDEVLSEDLQ